MNNQVPTGAVIIPRTRWMRHPLNPSERGSQEKNIKSHFKVGLFSILSGEQRAGRFGIRTPGVGG